MLVFMDLETTGLDPHRNVTLEVAVIITDDKLEPVARRSWVLRHSEADFALTDLISDEFLTGPPCYIDPVVRKMHTDNGLWQESLNSQQSDDEIDLELAAFITQHCPAVGERQGPQLAGNTVGFDRSFLAVDMPKTLATLHYRSLDVTALNEMARRFWPAVYEGRPKTAGSVHRAVADVEESLATARYYARTLGPITAAGPEEHW